jgi:hypothetical protein
MNQDNINVLAHETHNSPLWGCVLLLPMFGLIVAATSVPLLGIRIAMAAAGLVITGAAIMAWSGFHYIFTPAGLEIRTLGFRLRSVPAGRIREYAVGSWSIAGGYGIRGLGDRRAYVWGNKGVRIKTTEGEIFLGHNDPERVIRDLDLMKQFVH